MGSTQTKINEVMTATAQAPTAVSVSLEVMIFACVVVTVFVIMKNLRRYVKKQIRRQTIRAGLQN